MTAFRQFVPDDECEEAKRRSGAFRAKVGGIIEQVLNSSGSVRGGQSTFRHRAKCDHQAADSGTLEVAENIDPVANGAGETETTSGQMLQTAKTLSQVSIHLRYEVEKFFDSVRAASLSEKIADTLQRHGTARAYPLPSGCDMKPPKVR
jgi:methyl-accepting chemotaxis protein